MKLTSLFRNSAYALALGLVSIAGIATVASSACAQDFPTRPQRDIEKALAEPDAPATRDQFNQYVQTESVRFAEVIKKAKASLD